MDVTRCERCGGQMLRERATVGEPEERVCLQCGHRLRPPVEEQERIAARWTDRWRPPAYRA